MDASIRSTPAAWSRRHQGKLQGRNSKKSTNACVRGNPSTRILSTKPRTADNHASRQTSPGGASSTRATMHTEPSKFLVCKPPKQCYPIYHSELRLGCTPPPTKGNNECNTRATKREPGLGWAGQGLENTKIVPDFRTSSSLRVRRQARYSASPAAFSPSACALYVRAPAPARAPLRASGRGPLATSTPLLKRR